MGEHTEKQSATAAKTPDIPGLPVANLSGLVLQPFSFPLPQFGERDPFFSATRTFWIGVAVPGKGRPSPPVKSFLIGGKTRGRGRRVIDFASAKAFVERMRDGQVSEIGGGA